MGTGLSRQIRLMFGNNIRWRRRLLVLASGSILLLGMSHCTGGAGPEESPATASSDSLESAYDPRLAQELGADEYGMHRYVIAFLKAGPNQDQDSTTAAQLQQAHMANIRRLAEEGKLLLAGPMLDGGPLRGIYVFNVAEVEEARALTETDPAIQAGRLEMELHPWYGSAALLKIPEIHRQISPELP